MDKDIKYIAYRIIPDLRLIVEYYTGPVKGDDAIQLKITEKNDPNYDPHYNVLIDFRDIAINWTQSSDEALGRFIEFIKGNPELITMQKTSLLIAKPEQAVLSTLIKEQYIEFPMKIELFSTLDAALANLDISKESIQRISKAISEMKNEAVNRN